MVVFYGKIYWYMEKKRKILRFIGYISLFAYMIGMLYLVVFLKQQAGKGLVEQSVANGLFDFYAFTIGVALIIIMPFSLNRNNDKVTILSFVVFAILLAFAIYIKYFTSQGEVIADLLYIFSGAMFFQGVKCAYKWYKFGKEPVEDKE